MRELRVKTYCSVPYWQTFLFELYQDLALSNLSEKVSASTFGSGIAKEGA
jgi:hypothetical protein